MMMMTISIYLYPAFDDDARFVHIPPSLPSSGLMMMIMMISIYLHPALDDDDDDSRFVHIPLSLCPKMMLMMMVDLFISRPLHLLPVILV